MGKPVKARLRGAAVRRVAASSVEARLAQVCRFCGQPGGTTEVSAGPFSTWICEKCSEPVWKGMEAVDGAAKAVGTALEFYKWVKKVTR